MGALFFTVCVGRGMILGGLAMLFSSASWVFKNVKLKRTAQKTKGKVISLSENRSKGSRSFSPVFEFTTLDGVTVKVLDKTGTNPPRYQIGEVVVVKYSADDPENALIDDELNRNPNMAPFALGCASVAILLVGILFLIYGLIKFGVI